MYDTYQKKMHHDVRTGVFIAKNTAVGERMNLQSHIDFGLTICNRLLSKFYRDFFYIINLSQTSSCEVVGNITIIPSSHHDSNWTWWICVNSD